MTDERSTAKASTLTTEEREAIGEARRALELIATEGVQSALRHADNHAETLGLEESDLIDVQNAYYEWDTTAAATLRNLMQRLDPANIATQTWTEAEIREASEHLAPPPGSWNPDSDTWNDGYHEGYSNALRDVIDRLNAQKGGA